MKKHDEKKQGTVRSFSSRNCMKEIQTKGNDKHSKKCMKK